MSNKSIGTIARWTLQLFRSVGWHGHLLAQILPMKSKLLDPELFGLCTKFERSFVAFVL
jgi:hypothetical protein